MLTQENKDCTACSIAVTIYPEMNVTSCPDILLLIKHVIAKNVRQILFKGHNTILVTTCTMRMRKSMDYG